ncbi:MAG: peptide deformylase [Clostridia bacterium]|nr:peptide deformylase [Clostridia bacterium]
MAYREITTVENEVLRKKSKIVKEFMQDDESLGILLDDMAQTLERTDNGVGLAAPQVGILKRVVIINLNNMFLELVNPTIISKSKEEETCEEACLSVPGKRGLVKRPLEVTVQAFDRYGNKFTIKGEKFLARCLCHELDHLDGILYIDIMEKELKENK